MKQLTQSEFKKNGKIYKNISSPAPSDTQNQITDLIDDNGVLKQSTDGGSTFIEVETKQGYEAVKFTPQTLTEAEKLQARKNIGAGSAEIIDYNDTINKPILKTNNTTSQTPNASETIENTINLHKISKTGALADSIQDSTHRTVSDTEKADWNNTNFSRLTNVPKASTSTAGIIQIATDTEAENGTNETKAINPKQLLTAIQGLGSVFTLKGSKPTASDLPATGNTIGDVWYVVDESVGYIWLNDGTTDKWEQLGLPIDLSTYMQFSDVINNLTSDNIDKPLSAYQGKVLKAFVDTETTNRANADTDLQRQITTVNTKVARKVEMAGSSGGYTTNINNNGNAIELIVGQGSTRVAEILINADGVSINTTQSFKLNGGTISYDNATDTFSV